MVRVAVWTAGTVTMFEVRAESGVPDGGVATTEATFTTDPASRSDCVTVWAAVHDVATPGASDDAAHDTPVVFGSVTATAVSVTLPVLVTVNVYGIDSPTVVNEVLVVALVMVICGVCVAGTVTVFEGVAGIGEPPLGVPVTDAVLMMEPPSRSACVIVCVPVHVVLAPGANVVAAHDNPVTLASVMVIAVSVVAPVLVTVNEYGTDAPTVEYDDDVVDLAMVSDDASGALVMLQEMSSPTIGVMLNGTVADPDAGSTVGDNAVALTQLTLGLY